MYIIEGNIGAGKTTFLDIIDKAFPSITVVDEPLDSWNNREHGQSLLTQFYKDTSRWAFTMEMFTLMCRIKEHLREQQKSNQSIVMERSIYSGYYCFALNSYKQKFMSKLEWEIHKQWFDYLVRGKCINPTGFIYLKTSPEIAYKRTKKRNRSGEKSIALDYFKQIHERLEAFLIKKKNLLPGLEDVPVLVIDCNQEFAVNKIRKKKFLMKISDFLSQTQSFKPAQKDSLITANTLQK